MTYTYKQIGASAAVVATLFATAGGLLWWSRTASNVLVPRSQDEAEIMAACLERSYAQGLTNTKFVHTFKANVSKIIVTNTWSNGNAWFGWSSDPAHTGTEFAVYAFVTNSPAFAETNTVDFSPRATFQFPAAIRAAIAPGWGGLTRWIMPSNEFITGSGTWDGYMRGTNFVYLDSDTNWWTNLVTKPLATWRTTSNTVVSQFTNTWPGKVFSFERDRKSLFWSTNAYNDLSRPLSLMQWQDRPDDKASLHVVCVVKWKLPGNFPPTYPALPTGYYTIYPPIPASYVYDSNTTVTTSVTTNTGTAKLSALWLYEQDFVCLQVWDITQSPSVYLYNGMSYTHFSPSTNCWMRLTYVVEIPVSLLSNATCFSLTNITRRTSGVASVYTNNISPMLGLEDFLSSGPYEASTNVSVAPYASLAAAFPGPQTVDEVTNLTLTAAAGVFNAQLNYAQAFLGSPATPYADWWSYSRFTPSGGLYPLTSTAIYTLSDMSGSYGLTNTLFSVLDAFSCIVSNPASTYLLQFQCLTNYLNHAPAR